MDPRLSRLARGLGAVAAVAAGPAIVEATAGGWWSPFAIGLVVGLLATRTWTAIGLGALAGLATWGFPLAVEQLRYGVGPAATALSAILGLGHTGTYAIVLTLLIGFLLGVSGAWLGSAARSVAWSARVDARKGQ